MSGYDIITCNKCGTKNRLAAKPYLSVPICGNCKTELPYVACSSQTSEPAFIPIWRRLIGKSISYAIGYAFTCLILYWWFHYLLPATWQPFAWVLIALGVVVASVYSAAVSVCEIERKRIDAAIQRERRLKEQAVADAEVYKRTLADKAGGFPSLLMAIAEYEERRDEALAGYLAYKPHPAMKSADIVRQETARRREAELALKQSKSLIEYYEAIAPFLVDLKEDFGSEEGDIRFREYDDEESADTATRFLTKEEFRALPVGERNQLALDRFWSRPMSRWLIGRMYERYVGYIYEDAGYDVEYQGIFKGYDDLGRDLICRRGKEIIVIQCKNWSQFRTIYEKHIFQFFGTVFQYRDSNRRSNVRAVFYTATQLSDLARRFAQELDIELQENFKLDRSYPCIKCNVSRVDGSKIYHLPFDQQYDNVKVERERGEFYCCTVKEAERKGFRRAFRFTGIGKSPSSG